MQLCRGGTTEYMAPSTCTAWLQLLLLSTTALATFQNDFSLYPTNAQSCLNTASANSKCDGDTAREMNECLCSNGGNFVLSAAACISQTDNADLENVYAIMADACSFSKTPMTISQKDFLAAGSGTSTSISASSSTSRSASTLSTSTRSTSTSTSSSTTASVMTVTTFLSGHTTTYTTSAPTSSSSGTSQQSDSSGGMSSTAKIGIIAGAAVAAVAIIALAAFFIVRYRKRQAIEEETRPMLTSKSKSPQPDGMSGTELSNVSTEWKSAAYPSVDPKWQGSPSITSTTPTPYLGSWSPVQQQQLQLQLQQQKLPHMYPHQYQQQYAVAGGLGIGSGGAAVYELPGAEPPSTHVAEMQATEIPARTFELGSNTAPHPSGQQNWPNTTARP